MSNQSWDTMDDTLIRAPLGIADRYRLLYSCMSAGISIVTTLLLIGLWTIIAIYVIPSMSFGIFATIGILICTLTPWITGYYCGKKLSKRSVFVRKKFAEDSTAWERIKEVWSDPGFLRNQMFSCSFILSMVLAFLVCQLTIWLQIESLWIFYPPLLISLIAPMFIVSFVVGGNMPKQIINKTTTDSKGKRVVKSIIGFVFGGFAGYGLASIIIDIARILK